MESVAVTLGGSPTGQLTLRPVGREYPDASYPDVSWISTRVSIAAGAFRGEVDALLYADDFIQFRDGVRPLYADLAGTALFATPEEWGPHRDPRRRAGSLHRAVRGPRSTGTWQPAHLRDRARSDGAARDPPSTRRHLRSLPGPLATIPARIKATASGGRSPTNICPNQRPDIQRRSRSPRSGLEAAYQIHGRCPGLQ